MFDNVLHQNATELIAEDILSSRLPQSLLFSGPAGSAKLTCALEVARVLSCLGDSHGEKGNWNCTCPACLKHKALCHSSLLIIGSRECTLEIEAAKKTMLDAVRENAPYVIATRYLFVRSVRRLTMRFNPVLWEEDEKSGKISPLVASIDEALEEIDPLKPVLPIDELEKTVDSIVTNAKKLENSFLYDSIPVAQIRRASAWAHFTAVDGGKKVLIIENADSMQESARNALLKILEEPPEDVTFILTTTRRGAVLPTILSRVRTYPFPDRSPDEQNEVIDRIFHASSEGGTVTRYLESFLPIKSERLSELACSYLLTVQNIPPLVRRIIMQRFNPRDGIPLEMIVSEANNFEPKILFTLFLKEVLDVLRQAVREKGITAQEQNSALAWLTIIRNVSENVTLFNQSASSALEYLSGELSKTELLS